ncbi:hypothetical protein DSCW_62690 [Desulfosarcina widdelii]|uniref:Uncharacterized protein n=1 Tax=Desulfosarcina widdelii TaxID=947919 RepID=A0A5K7ZA02_9BACT|nr:hypothetical protein DSCW_62690 [Desulfosarcina widdelii]
MSDMSLSAGYSGQAGWFSNLISIVDPIQNINTWFTAVPWIDFETSRLYSEPMKHALVTETT